ncbi:MAG TPA: ABC transporter permease [Pyrinomonadaceae bacterium]|nr:ABC transporter permease [Pyrinomonadaceae bacterium]
MKDSRQKTRFRFWLWLIQIIGVIVPRRFRADWQHEWEAELQHRELILADWDRLNWRNKLDLLRRSSSAFWDALWLQPKRWEDEMFQDLRFGVRMLLKNKSFTTVAVLSLALGIGANTAIFQLLDAVRLRTLPVPAPHELAEVRMTNMKGARGGFFRTDPTVTNQIWEQIRDRQQAFSGAFAWGTDTPNLAQGGEVRLARMLYLSGDAFNTLRIQPALGRLITTADDHRGCGAPGLVISHTFWQSEFGSDADVVGRKLTVADQPFEIIGVTPANFFGMEVGRSFDLALPLCAVSLVRGNNRMLESGTNWWLTVTGRLKHGWTMDQATVHLQSISPELFEAALPAKYPPASVKDYLDSKLTALPAGSGVSQLRQEYEQPLWLLLAIAGLVLLIACANLANLLLARASAREREFALRQALGASRARLIRQLIVESLLLAALGAALGAGLAQALSRLLVAFLSTSNNPIFLDLGLDWRVLGFTAGLAVLTCLLFGLAPAIRVTQKEPGAVMKLGGRGLTAGRQRFSLQRGLVVVQVALSLVLVAGAVLFSRSLDKLLTVDTGFNPEGVLTAVVRFQRLNLPPDRNVVFQDELVERIRVIPGVEAASVGSTPFRDWGGGKGWMDGQDSKQPKNVSLSRVGSDYFNTLQIPLLAGRDFNSGDRPNSPNVLIVNEAFSKAFLQGANPVGHRFWIAATPGDPDTVYEIVGLVRNTKYEDLREEFQPIAYYAAAQDSETGAGASLLIRSRVSQGETVAAVKRVLNEINPAITVSFQEFKPMIEATIMRERLMATLSGFFGLLALLLACVGLYGILSYGVASRTNEIGIRMALGARKETVFWLILREAFLLVVAGLVVGFPVIFAVTRLASSLLFGLSPTDPISLTLAALLMLAVAMVAGYIPSRRATRVDPLIALRYE